MARLNSSRRGKRKLFQYTLLTRAYSGASLKPFEGAVFEGWDQPIKADTEGNSFRGNACFNFVPPSGATELGALEIQAWVESGQRNPFWEKWRALAVSMNVDAEHPEVVVYPELAAGAGHAVIDRILDAQGVTP